MGIQYLRTAGWDVNLLDAVMDEYGLVIRGMWNRPGAPATTAGHYEPSCILQNIADGSCYQNTGTTAVPIWSLIDTSTGGLPALADGRIWVGNGLNVATAVVPSGDATMSNIGAFTLNTQGVAMEVGFINTTAAPQALSGPGAVLIASYQTLFTSTGTGDALTLGNATKIGHLKKVSYVAEAAGGDTGVITPATGTFTTATLNAIGDYVVFIWTGTAGWFVIEVGGTTVIV